MDDSFTLNCSGPLDIKLLRWLKMIDSTGSTKLYFFNRFLKKLKTWKSFGKKILSSLFDCILESTYIIIQFRFSCGCGNYLHIRVISHLYFIHTSYSFHRITSTVYTYKYTHLIFTHNIPPIHNHLIFVNKFNSDLHSYKENNEIKLVSIVAWQYTLSFSGW